MLARLRILLPFKITIPEGENLQPQEYDVAPYRVVLHPPLQADIDIAAELADLTAPLLGLDRGLIPAAPPRATDAILLDGRRTIQANLLQVDFFKDQFDRRRSVGEAGPGDDPPLVLGFELANSLLRRFRSVAQAARATVISPLNTLWAIQFLADDGAVLPADPALMRRRFALGFQIAAQAVTRPIWEKINSLQLDYEPPTWDNLLLDAELLLPHVGAAIVLAAAAIETAASFVLNHVASQTTTPKPLWDWINERDSWLKEPSVEERCDELLKALTGKSLKEDEPGLWQAFQNLRTARNKFVHEGAARVGGRELNADEATQLVAQAKDVVNYLEALLPEEKRRPLVAVSIHWQFTKPLAPPAQGAP